MTIHHRENGLCVRAIIPVHVIVVGGYTCSIVLVQGVSIYGKFSGSVEAARCRKDQVCSLSRYSITSRQFLTFFVA